MTESNQFRLKKILTLLLLFSGLFCQGQDSAFPVDARSNGFGYAAVARSDVYSISGNTASLAGLQDIIITASIQNNFLIADLIDYSISCVFPMKNSGIGVYLEHFDFEAYRQQIVALGYGLSLNQKLSIGLRMRYLNYLIPEESSVSTLNGGVYVIYNLNDQLRLGMELNPFNGRQFSMDQRMLKYQKLGLSYQPSEVITVSGDLIYQTGLTDQFSGAVGVSYTIRDEVEVQVGYRSNPDFISIGTRVTIWNGLNLYVSVSIHQQLDITPVSGFDYRVIRN